jgi:hypothetical protein
MAGVSARNGNLELPVYFLKAKEGYIVTTIKKVNGYSTYY